jgi:hypothetical protein
MRIYIKNRIAGCKDGCILFVYVSAATFMHVSVFEDNENERAVRKEPIHNAIKPENARRLGEQM